VIAWDRPNRTAGGALAHLGVLLRREGGEGLFDLRQAVAARRAAWRGDPVRAAQAQATRIRFVRRARESLDSYRRLDRLLAAPGAPTDFDIAAPDPAAGAPACFVCFVGYSRSGHSLVGSLLDAHPDAAIAHEVHALKHLAAGADVAGVLWALARNARIFHVLGRTYTGYDYVVPGQWQGRVRRLRVLGDKKGNGSARLLAHDPDAAARIEARMPVPVHYVHVVRNPYDNIATKALRTGRSVEDAARRYLRNVAAIARLKARAGARVHDLHLDDLIADPPAVLVPLVASLGLDPAAPGYLDACGAILFKTPSRTRDRVVWPDSLRAHLATRFGDTPFLARYVER